MILDSVRMLSDALSDPTYGVAAQLALMVSGGKIESGDTPPSSIVIADETRDAQAAVGRPDADENAVSVTAFLIGIDITDEQRSIMYGQHIVTLGVRVDAVAEDAELNIVAMALTLRAAVACVQWWFRNAPEAMRERNGVQWINGTSLGIAHFITDPNADRGTIGLKLAGEVTDTLFG